MTDFNLTYDQALEEMKKGKILQNERWQNDLHTIVNGQLSVKMSGVCPNIKNDLFSQKFEKNKTPNIEAYKKMKWGIFDEVYKG